MLDYQQIILIERCPLASMLYPIPSSEKKKAVQYLIDNIPTETLEKVAECMKEDSKNWGVLNHHGFGTYVRNLLRKGEFDWGPIDLDKVWIGLVEKAAKKKLGKAVFSK